jgi:hypothetical protein
VDVAAGRGDRLASVSARDSPLNWPTITPGAVGRTVAVCLLALAAIPAGASARPAAPAATEQSREAAALPCVDKYRNVRAQGRSCRVAAGLWKVRLGNGSTVLTHGPDSARLDPADNGQHDVFSPDAVPRSPTCASSNAFAAILATPSDVSGDETVASYRARLRAVNGILHHAAVESGAAGGANLRFACDGTGQIKVDVVKLSFPASAANFDRIAAELQDLGYVSTSLLYAVYYDAPVGAFGGQASLRPDETAGATNASNQGGVFAITYDSDDETVLHEMGHNLGAVQDGAPFSTGERGGHCYEDHDVMCYNDGGARDPGSLVSTCTDFDHFDCGHDTYFDARVGAAQGGGAAGYLGTHWNIGACYVVWIVNSACAGGGPANDAFGAAGPVNTTPFGITGLDTTSATSQAGEPSPSGPGCAPLGNTVWYRYVAPRDRTLTAQTTGLDASTPDSDFDTVLAAYRGTSLAGLTQVACNDDIDNAGGNLRSRVEFDVEAGQTYYFQVGGYRDTTTTPNMVASGQLTFSISLALRPPSNDDLAAAAAADSLPYTDLFLDTADATEEPSEPAPNCAPVGKTVWYRFTAPTTGRFVADTLGHTPDTPDSDFDTVLQVYRGSSGAALTPLGCSDDIDGPTGNQRSRVPFDAQAGQTYHVQVGGFRQSGETNAEAASGSLNFSLRAAPPPVHDAFAQRLSIDSLPYSPLGLSTLGASPEGGEPASSCGGASDTVWYSLTPDRDMTVSAETAGSDFDTLVAVYEGAGPGGLTEVTCSDDLGPTDRRSRVEFGAAAGRTYHFQVGGFDQAGEYGARSGRLVFKVAGVPTQSPEPPPPQPPPREPPRPEPPIDPGPPPPPPDRSVPVDRTAPRVTALTSKGRRGRKARLRYRVTDDRRVTREVLRIYRGSRRLAVIRTAFGPAEGARYFTSWAVPEGLAKRPLRFCVTSTDRQGNTSRRSCARLKIR